MQVSDVDSAAGVVWQVGALCRAVADALAARFNPVTVRGELSGFSRASSGHCYFSLKDESGQLRCAMFRRAAGALDFSPRDGEQVELQGQLDVYQPRGDLQLIVQSMRRFGQGALFEQFLRLKAKLEAEGLFAVSNKRPLPLHPRGIGLVTSPGAAALHDVVSVLQRRAPHVAVVLAPAAVQGSGAPAELVAALSSLYALARQGPTQAEETSGKNRRKRGPTRPTIDVILLVRGGGSIEDLWAFNDEQLVRMVAQSPVPVVSGVGHETDFTLVDFVADLRAPTPTAAAELAAPARDAELVAIQAAAHRLQDVLLGHLEEQAQRLDVTAARLGRPSALLNRQQMRLGTQLQLLRSAMRMGLERRRQVWQGLRGGLPQATQRALQCEHARLERAQLRLGLLDPSLVLQRGYAWLTDQQGGTIASVTQTKPGQALRATLFDGEVDLTVGSPN